MRPALVALAVVGAWVGARGVQAAVVAWRTTPRHLDDDPERWERVVSADPADRVRVWQTTDPDDDPVRVTRVFVAPPGTPWPLDGDPDDDPAWTRLDRSGPGAEPADPGPWWGPSWPRVVAFGAAGTAAFGALVVWLVGR